MYTNMLDYGRWVLVYGLRCLDKLFLHYNVLLQSTPHHIQVSKKFEELGFNDIAIHMRRG